MTFKEELDMLIFKYTSNNKSNTPDFLLARYIDNCLTNLDGIIKKKHKINKVTKKIKDDDNEPYNVRRWRKENDY